MISIGRHIKIVASFTLFSAFAVTQASAAVAQTHELPDGLMPVATTQTIFADSAVEYWAQSQITASEAKGIARQRHPSGEIVDILRDGPNYRVRLILKDGRVVDLFIDAATGRILK